MDRYEYEEKRDELVLLWANNLIDWDKYVELMNELEGEWEKER